MTDNPVEICEREYPELTEAFKLIQREQYELFCRKHMNYGLDNISLGTSLESNDDRRLSLTGIWFRVHDKIQRLRQLVINRVDDMVGEDVNETLNDMSNYGVIARLVNMGKWKR